MPKILWVFPNTEYADKSFKIKNKNKSKNKNTQPTDKKSAHTHHTLVIRKYLVIKITATEINGHR